MKLRASNIQRLDDRIFDVLIVGGGINGAVSAAALAGQGARTALIDRLDFSACTSQESSNLIWGGIKYLESYEFGLVRKLSLSRNHLLRHYPSTVQEVRFFVTLEKGFRHNRWTLFMGSLLYWLMGNFFTRYPRLLSLAKMQREEGVLRLDRSTGGFEYSDAFLHDNDARFVFNFIREALDHGAILANYVESLGSRRQGDLWITTARDNVEGREITIRSRALINACGPFVDEHNRLTGEQTEHRHLFSKGIHLIVNRLTESRRVLTFFADDGRLFFAIPMGPKTCIGTTDTRVETPRAQVTPEDRQFILDNINKRLRLDRDLTVQDIIAERCGVRPLVISARTEKKDKGDWSSLSRKHAVDVNREHAHVSIFGGKLTDCLNVGEEVSEIVESLGIELPFRGALWYGESPQEIKRVFFHQARLMQLDRMTAPESTEPLSIRLWRRYGASALTLLEDIRQDPAMAEVLIRGTEYIRCELHLAARREMIVRLEDFLRRRSQISLIETKDEIYRSPGLMEACSILFGDRAREKFEEYFSGGL